jgi:ribosomal protein S3AE
MARKSKQPTKKRKASARKKFFEMTVPLTSTKVKLYGYEAEELVGGIVKLDLSRSLRGKNVELRAKVILEDEKLTGDLLSISLIPSHVKRMVRRGTDYVEDSFFANCKDSKLIVKPLIVTRNRVSKKVRNEIRKAARKFLESHITIRNSKEIFSEIMTNKIQKALSSKVKKVYPPALCEIRFLEVKEKITPAQKAAKKVESKETPKKTTDSKEEVKKEIKKE